MNTLLRPSASLQKMERTEKRIYNKPEQRHRIGSFIQIHPVVFIVNEIQRPYTVKHNTIMSLNNVLRVSVHPNHHQAHLLRKFTLNFGNKCA